jgi:hypothetical protein
MTTCRYMRQLSHNCCRLECMWHGPCSACGRVSAPLNLLTLKYGSLKHLLNLGQRLGSLTDTQCWPCLPAASAALATPAQAACCEADGSAGGPADTRDAGEDHAALQGPAD